MGEIKLNGINIKNRSVEYEFEISEDLKNFFSGREFIIVFFLRFSLIKGSEQRF